MQSNLFVCAPNLIGDIYRNNVVQSTAKFHKSYDFIDFNQDGVFALGTSDLSGRIWSGTIWVFEEVSDVPERDECLAHMDFESGISVGRWFNSGKNIAVGTDNGTVDILCLNSMLNSNKQYLSLVSTMSDHADGITSMDISSDSMKIMTGSRDMSIKIFDAKNAAFEKGYAFAHGDTVNSVSFKPGSTNILISTSNDGNSLLWDTRKEKPASLLLNTEGGFTASGWIDDNHAVLGSNGGSVFMVDTRQKVQMDEVACSERPVHYVNVESSSQLVAVCADDPVVRVYNCSGKNFQKVYECDKHEDFVRGLCWKPPNILFSCGFGMDLQFHEILLDDKDKTTNAGMGEGDKSELPNKE